MVLALTQSGKTGGMLSLIKNYLSHAAITIPTENIYIITGLSSQDWCEQTKGRIPASMRTRVFHRDELTSKFVDDIYEKENVLIIIDEVQIAAKENQTLHKAFESCKFYELDYVLKKDIKIIEFTATPDGTYYDYMRWKGHSACVKMNPGVGYTSCFDLQNTDRIKQFQDLCGLNKKTGKINESAFQNIQIIKNMIEKKYSEARFHIISTPNGDLSTTVINNFQ